MQLTLLSYVITISLIIHSQLAAASPTPSDLPGGKYNGELECEHYSLQ